MNEFAAAERDPDMRCALRDRLEEHEVAWPDVIAVDVVADLVLLPNLAGQRHALLREYPLDEAAAVEPLRVAASVR